jgi:hypothetical protein
MFKRVRWMTMGAAVGFGGSVWAQRRVKRRVGQYLPDRMSADVVQWARYLADDVRDALQEGRDAMRAREEELRRQLGVPGPARSPGPRSSSRLLAGEARLPAGEPGRHRRRRRSVPVIESRPVIESLPAIDSPPVIDGPRGER